MSTDQVTIGSAIGNTYRNAPFVVEFYYSMFWFITLLMVTAFVNSAAAREFASNMHQIIFTKPIRKSDFLLGRFLGSVVVSTIPMLGISIGALLAQVVPWADKDRFGPVVAAAHLQGILVFALPNTLFVAAIIFTIAALTRSTVVSFLGALGLIVADIVSGVLTQKLDNEKVAAMLDPFGSDAFGFVTKYWTVADKNTHVLSLCGLLLWNRLVWVGWACRSLPLPTGDSAFQSARAAQGRSEPRRRKLPRLRSSRSNSEKSTLDFGAGTRLRQFFGIVRIEYRRLLKSIVFIIITCVALINCLAALIFSARQGFGLTTRPSPTCCSRSSRARCTCSWLR